MRVEYGSARCHLNGCRVRQVCLQLEIPEVIGTIVERLVPDTYTVVSQSYIASVWAAAALCASRGLKSRTHEMVSTTYADWSAVMNDINEVTAEVSGNVVQAHVIHGDVWVAAPPGASGVPRQLPAVTRYFVGREAEISRLADLAQRPPDHGVALCVVGGPAGVGKTTLAVWWGHQASQLFPDGQLYLNLRGFDPSGHSVSAVVAARSLLEVLRVPTARIPSDLDGCTALFRDLVYNRRLLLVLDNVRDSDQVRPLLPGSGQCFVIVTTRKRLDALHVHYGAEFIDLTPFRRSESSKLFERYIGIDQVAVDGVQLDRLAAMCSDLPLALTIVAAQLSLQNSASPTAVVTGLDDERTRWDMLSLGATADTDIRAVISWSYDLLSDQAARTFRLLSLHPGESMSGDAAITLSGLPQRDARRALDELFSHNLVVDAGAGRCRFHDLLRAYALNRCHVLDARDEQAAAAGRLLDHYVRTAFVADRWLNSHRRTISLATTLPGVVVSPVRSYPEAISWFSLEADNLLAAARYAIANGWYVHAWQLPWTMVNYLYLRGRFQDGIDLHRDALDATRELADRRAEARVLHTLARAHSEIGKHDDALAHYRTALSIYQTTHDVNGQANSLNGMSGSFIRLGRHPEALTHAVDALRFYEELADPIGQASTLNLLGRIHLMLGDRRAAVACHRRALKLFRQAGDTYGQAHTLDAFGVTLSTIGRARPAAACHGRAIGLHVALGNRYYLAISHQSLAGSLQELGHHAAARVHVHEAVAILDELGHPLADEIRAALRPSDQ